MFEYEEAREYDGGELGSIIGFNVEGHLSDRAIELFCVMVDEEELLEDGGDFNVTLCYVRKVPSNDEDGTYMFQYQKNPGKGAKKVTYFELDNGWKHLCVKHPNDLAACGVHKSALIDGEQFADEYGFVYLCRPCADDLDRRQKIARNEAMKKYYEEKEMADAK